MTSAMLYFWFGVRIASPASGPCRAAPLSWAAAWTRTRVPRAAVPTVTIAVVAFTFLCPIDTDPAAVDFLAIESETAFGGRRVGIGDEPEPSTTPSLAIEDHLRLGHLTMGREDLLEPVTVHPPRESSNEEFRRHLARLRCQGSPSFARCQLGLGSARLFGRTQSSIFSSQERSMKST